VFVADDGIHGRELWTLVDINAAPSFVKGADVSATDEDGPRAIDGWASGIVAGPPDESGQTVQFVLQADTNPGIFAAGPNIDASGKLTFTPLPNASGTANVTIVLKDDGGTANDGVDTSPPQTFAITITKPHPWHNALNAMDVNGDGQVTPADALAVINLINSIGPGPLTGVSDGNFYDVRADNFLSPSDALMIINYLNSLPRGGEGEADTSASTPADLVFQQIGTQAAVDDQVATNELLLTTIDGTSRRQVR